MKKDFLLAGVLSLALFGLTFAHLGKTAHAFRQLAFYLVYPTSFSLTHALEYGSQLGRFWRELLSSRQELDALREILRNQELKRFEEELAKETSRENEYSKFLETSAHNEFKAKGFSLTFRAIAYRSISPLGWTSRACLDSASRVRENLPVLVYSLKSKGFVFLGRTLSASENFGRLSCLELVTSPGFNIIVRGEDSQETGLLQGVGESRRLSLNYLDKDSSIQVGERILTSPLSALAPSGIAVGQVIGFKDEAPGSLFKMAYVEPYAELGRIQKVAILHWLP